MKVQFDNQVMSSFLMWFDHTLLDKGEAHYLVTGQFGGMTSYYPGYYTYSSPYKGMVYDTSISGATVMTGVYVGNTLYNFGTAPLTGVNYQEGKVILTTQTSSPVSGIFSVKEFNVLLTNQAEEIVLFETQYTRRNKTAASTLTTGLLDSQITYPVIFLRNDGSQNTPLAFGGTDETRINIRAFVLTDSQYSLDAVCSLFRDRNYDLFYLMNQSDNPFNVFGSFKDNVPFNYNTKTSTKDYCIIDKISISRIPSVRDRENNLNPGLFYGIVDFEIIKFRDPRR